MLRREVPLLIQVLNDLLRSLLDPHLVALDVDFRLQRLLVRRTDTGELLDLTGPRALVQTLRIPLLGHLDGHIDVHLHERETEPLARTALRGRLVKRTSHIPILSVRGDERGDRDGVGVREELGDLRDAADVLVAVRLAEPEVLVQAEADVVAVEAVGGDAAVAEELVLEFDGDGGFARGGEAG